MLIAQLLLILPVALAARSVPTGLINSSSTCFLNSLLSCLYDLSRFRQAVYRNFDANEVMSAMAGVFARKQLNNLPALDISHDMIRTVADRIPRITIGRFNDIDELFRFIFDAFPPEVANSIGIKYSQQLLSPERDYLIGENPSPAEPFLIIPVPDSRRQQSLQSLVEAKLFAEELVDFTLHPDEHFNYFQERNLPMESRPIQAVSRRVNIQYADVLPVFVARARRQDVALKDRIHVDEVLEFPDNPARYTLMGFAVFNNGHYYTYVRSAKDLKWYLHNDESVRQVEYKDFVDDMERKAVLFFYTRVENIPEPEIPPLLRLYAEESNRLQDLHYRLQTVSKNSKKPKSRK